MISNAFITRMPAGIAGCIVTGKQIGRAHV